MESLIEDTFQPILRSNASFLTLDGKDVEDLRKGQKIRLRVFLTSETPKERLVKEDDFYKQRKLQVTVMNPSADIEYPIVSPEKDKKAEAGAPVMLSLPPVPGEYLDFMVTPIEVGEHIFEVIYSSRNQILNIQKVSVHVREMVA